MNINTLIGLMQKSTKLEKKLGGTIMKVSKQANQINETIRDLSKKLGKRKLEGQLITNSEITILIVGVEL
jgi:hypothetical protein